MSKNLKRIILMSILTSFDFFSAIEVAYFFQKSLSASEIYLIYAIFSILVFVLEVPTGYLGDKIGYKNSILLGLFNGILGFMGFLFAKGFIGIIISYLFMALMTSFISGSDDAILYDCLKQDDREKDFENVYAKIQSFSYAVTIIGNVLAGFIASKSMAADVIVQMGLLVIALVIFTGINVVSEYEDEEEENGRLTTEIKKSKSLVILLLLAGLFMTSTLLGTKFSQQIMLAGKIPIAFFGIFSAMMTVVASFFSYIAPKIKGVSFGLIMLVPSLVLVAIGASGNGWFVLLLIVTSMSRALGNIKLSVYINQQISSKYRATINSMKSLIFRVFYSILIFAAGKLADENVFFAVMVCGVVLVGLIGLLLIIRGRNVSRNDIPATEQCSYKGE